MKKMLLLLGAGASVETGLLSAKAVTEYFCNLSQHTAWTQAPLVEQLFNGLRAKIAAGTGEPVEDVDFEAIFGVLVDAVDGVRSVFIRKDIDHVLSSASEHVDLQRLTRDLTLYLQGLYLPVESIEYLDPLFEAVWETSGTIATLNYDVSVERRFLELGHPLKDGFNKNGRWEGFDNSEPGVELLKMHGSVHWLRWSYSSRTKQDVLHRLVMKSPRSFRSALNRSAAWVSADNQFGVRLLINVGIAKEQLYITPPFDEIFSRFRRKLAEGELIIIAGYSFRDEAINRMLVESLKDRRVPLVVIDPAIEDLVKTRAFLQALDDYGVLSQCPKRVGAISRADVAEWLELRLAEAPTGVSFPPDYPTDPTNHRAHDLVIQLVVLEHHLKLVLEKVETGLPAHCGLVMSLIQTLERCWETYIQALRAARRESSAAKPWESLRQPPRAVQFTKYKERLSQAIESLQSLLQTLDFPQRPEECPELVKYLLAVAEILTEAIS